MVSPLKLVRDKPSPRGKQVARDANDVLSSFPEAKENRREPTPEEQNKRTIKDIRMRLGKGHYDKSKKKGQSASANS